MGELAANRPFPNTLQQRLDLAGGVIVDAEMGTSITIYEGSFVGFAAGTGTANALATSDCFYGIAMEKKTSTATAGATKIKLFVGGCFQHAITSLVVADVGKVVFATAASLTNVLDITSTTLNAVGRVVGFVSAGVGVIKMKWPGHGAGVSNAATVVFSAVPL